MVASVKVDYCGALLVAAVARLPRLGNAPFIIMTSPSKTRSPIKVVAFGQSNCQRTEVKNCYTGERIRVENTTLGSMWLIEFICEFGNS